MCQVLSSPLYIYFFLRFQTKLQTPVSTLSRATFQTHQALKHEVYIVAHVDVGSGIKFYVDT